MTTGSKAAPAGVNPMPADLAAALTIDLSVVASTAG
jgi:hypothetical protein